MKRFLSILVAVAFALTAMAQSESRKDIDAHPHLANTTLSVYSGPYFFKPIAEAPKGYKPFYISHYGRHGSRHEAHDWYVLSLVELLESADEMNILTPKGKELKAMMTKISEAHHQRYGDLTRVGFEQHKGIARRMYERFKPVFYRGAIIDSRSSDYTRCVLSMAAFNESLKECEPMLETRMDAAIQHKSVVRPSMPFLKDPRYAGRVITGTDEWWLRLSAWAEKHDFSHSCNLVFTNIEPLCKKYNRSMQSIMIDLYKRLDAVQNLGWHDRSFIDSIFSADERHTIYLYENYRWYCRYATTSVENGLKRYAPMQATVNDIISYADLAIEGKNSAAANLRFGHDYYILGLLAVLNCNEYPSGLDISDVDKLNEKWSSYKMVTMASNLQMVLYRSKKSDDILVRFLENENDITLPIKSVEGPFYKWEDVRNYMNERMALICN